MPRARTIRMIRIAVVGLCLVNFAVLLGLWLRSFEYSEGFFCRPPVGKSLDVWSGVGRIVFTLHPTAAGEAGVHYQGPWEYSRGWRAMRQRLDESSPTRLGFGAGTLPNGEFRLTVPYWFTMLLVAGLVAGSWIISARNNVKMNDA